jgi:NAD(P)-dependent dehydrogenase (short-subunit alcohol dehydrogenase family)
LADLNSVEEASNDIISQFGLIDLILNNAGVMALPSKQVTAQGVAMQSGTKQVGHFAFTHSHNTCSHICTPNGRVDNVASTAHTMAKATSSSTGSSSHVLIGNQPNIPHGAHMCNPNWPTFYLPSDCRNYVTCMETL